MILSIKPIRIYLSIDLNSTCKEKIGQQLSFKVICINGVADKFSVRGTYDQRAVHSEQMIRKNNAQETKTMVKFLSLFFDKRTIISIKYLEDNWDMRNYF